VKKPGAFRDRGADLYERMRRQGRAYLRGLVWLLGDSLRGEPRAWWKIIIATGVTLAGNAAAVGIIYLYVKLLQHDAQHSVLGHVIRARESTLLLGLVVSGLLVALLAFAVSDYISKATALRLTRRYEERTFKRVLRLYRLLPDPRARGAELVLDAATPRQLAMLYARNCGWSVRFVANAVPAIFMFFFALGTLVLLDPITTLVVLVLGLGALAAQYPANLFAAKASKTVDQTQRHVSDAFNALMERLNRSPRPEGPDALDTEIERFFEEPRAHRYMDANEDRFRAMELSGLSVRVGGALVLAAILLTIAASLLKHGGDWAVLIAYLGVLRLLLNSTTQLFRAVTVFSRFYPYTKELQDFITATEAAREPPIRAADRATAGELRIAAQGFERDIDTLPLRPGSLVGVWVMRGYGRDLERALMRAVQPPNAAGAAQPRCELVITPPSAGQIESWGQEGSQGAREAWIEGLRRQGELEMGLERAERHGAELLLIDRVALEALPPDRWAEWRRRLADRVLAVVYADPRMPPVDLGESLLLVRTRSDHFFWEEIPPDGLTAAARAKLHPLLALRMGPETRARGSDDLVDE
jgi:hypothetical protein